MRLPGTLLSMLVLLSLVDAAHGQRGRRGFGGLRGWISDDLSAGIRESKRTGKPLLVAFRCPP